MGSFDALDSAPDKKLAAICGLFCPACTFYIASTEEPERLGKLAQEFGRPPEALRCHGCRSEKRGIYCEKMCKMTPCAAQRGVGFCGECDEYPCADLKAFQAQMPHRIELLDSQEMIRREGFEAWYADTRERYSCPECRTINSAYDLTCRRCGADPSCAYVGAHRDQVLQLVEKMGR